MRRCCFIRRWEFQKVSVATIVFSEININTKGIKKVKTNIRLLLLTLSLAFLCSSHAAQAGDKEWALNIGSGGLLAKKSLSDSGALVFGANYSSGDYRNNSGETLKYFDILLELGYRKYLGGTEIKHFVNGSVAYAHPSSSGNISSSDPVFTGLLVGYGLEKHLSDSFSIEGSADVRISHTEADSYKDTHLSFFNTRLAINYYF